MSKVTVKVVSKPPCKFCGYSGPDYQDPKNHGKNCLYKRMEEHNVLRRD